MRATLIGCMNGGLRYLPYDPKIHHRRSIRLKGYDYASFGAYSVTICTQGRMPLLGHIEGGRMILSPAGEMVKDTLARLPEDCPGVHPDVSVVMPNHVHAILIIEGRDDDDTPQWPLGSVIGRLKSVTTLRYVAGVRDLGWTPFEVRLWQRNYYDHVIRDDRDLDAIREYIANNPAQWAVDADNSERW